MLASSYPLLDLFWTMLMIFLFVFWIFILIQIVVDIFRSHDMNGWVKAIWLIFILIVPFLSVLVYLIARGGKMQQHQAEAAKQQQAFNSYIQDTAGTSTADQLSTLAKLKDEGHISEAEFDAQKAKLLS